MANQPAMTMAVMPTQTATATTRYDDELRGVGERRQLAHIRMALVTPHRHGA